MATKYTTFDRSKGGFVDTETPTVYLRLNLNGTLTPSANPADPLTLVLDPTRRQRVALRQVIGTVVPSIPLRPRDPNKITWGPNGFLNSNQDVLDGKYGATYNSILKRYVIRDQNFRAPAPGTPAFRVGVQYGQLQYANLVTLPLLFINCNNQGWGRDTDNQSIAIVQLNGQHDVQFEECMWLPLYPYTAPPTGITAGFPGLAINSINGAYLGFNHCEFYSNSGVRVTGWSSSGYANTGYARPFLARWNKFRNIDNRKHDSNGVWATGVDTSAFFVAGGITFYNVLGMPNGLMEYTDVEQDPKTGCKTEDWFSMYQSYFPIGQEFYYRFFRHKNLLTYDPNYTGSQQYILRRPDGSRIGFSGTSGNLGDGVCYPDSSYKWSAGNLTADMFPHGLIFENGVIVNAAHFGIGFSSGNRMKVRNVALISAGAIRSQHPSGYTIIYTTPGDTHAPYTAWDFVQQGNYDSSYPNGGDSRYFFAHVMDNVDIFWLKVADAAAATVTPVAPYIPNQVAVDSMTYLNTPAVRATPASVLAALDIVDGIENSWIAAIANAAGATIGCTT